MHDVIEIYSNRVHLELTSQPPLHTPGDPGNPGAPGSPGSPFGPTVYRNSYVATSYATP